MADNSAALRRTRRQDSQSKRRRAAAVLEAMDQSGQEITFPAVARRAEVSVSLLYADRDLASRIATARNRQRQAGRERAWRLPARSLVTEQSLRVELANTKEQARRLSAEVTVLRHRLARQLGADADVARGTMLTPLLDDLEQRAGELEATNQSLRRRIVELEGEINELTETLDAARSMNRELMSEINRSATAPAHKARLRG